MSVGGVHAIANSVVIAFRIIVVDLTDPSMPNGIDCRDVRRSAG